MPLRSCWWGSWVDSPRRANAAPLTGSGRSHSMKLHFEPNLDYQRAAIEAVCDLFRGQEICRTDFTVTRSAVDGAFLPGLASDVGIGNRRLGDALRGLPHRRASPR